MGSLNLLEGVRALEVSLFAPDALGGHLADLGAEVIKVEQPGGGGFRGELFARNNVEDLQWNRGKKSVTLDLKTPEGRNVFLELAAKVDVVINGLRSGAAERLGFGYDDVVRVKPDVVYCTLNGMGTDGPYAELPTHGLSFDCFAGLTPPVFDGDGHPHLPATGGTIGVIAGPLFGALAVLAALHRAKARGEAQYVEVSQVDAAIGWNFQKLTALANGRAYASNGMRDSIRYQYYETADAEYVVFMALEDKFWLKFCQSFDRMDLYERGRAPLGQFPEKDGELRRELADIFKKRTREEWTSFFLDNDIAGAPAFLGSDLLDNEHVRARGLVYTQTLDDGEEFRMVGTCVKTPGATFSPSRSPGVGEHTAQVLADLLGLGEAEIAELRATGAV